MTIRDMYIKYISSKTWTYPEYVLNRELDKAYITAGFDTVYREGKNCPFTVHEAIVEDSTASVLVSGRCYTRKKWRSRLGRGLRVDMINFYSKENDMEIWNARCSA